MMKIKTKTTKKTKTKKNKKNKTKTVTTSTTTIVEPLAPVVPAGLVHRRRRAVAKHASLPSALYTLASALKKNSSDGEIAAVLKTLAQEKLGPLTQDRILSAIKESTGIRLRSLQLQLAAIEQELGSKKPDGALALADRVRTIHFKEGSHILRSADGSYWKYDKTHWIETTGDAICRLMFCEATKQGFSTGALKRLVRDAKSLFDNLIDHGMMGFNDDPASIVNCANGEVCIDQNGKAERLPHRPESRLTYCLAVTFESQATCPMYDKALLEIFGNAHDPSDMARHWNEFVGYAIQPRRDIPSFWLLIGHGSNGKTKLLKTIQALVGPQAVLNDDMAKFQQDRFNAAALTSKLLFIDDDIAINTQLNDGLLKKISEDKEMSARHAYGKRKQNFVCRALPIMAGNNYPTTSDISHGFRRRLMVIPFDKKFGPGEADRELFSKIWACEMPGILNRALEGLQRLRQRGDFWLPVDCRKAADEFMAHANPLVGFIDDRCEPEPNALLPLEQFRALMKRWANSQGTKGPAPIKTLQRQLEALDYKVEKQAGHPRVHGLRVKESPAN
jgi:putative DNA primase/helicase